MHWILRCSRFPVYIGPLFYSGLLPMLRLILHRRTIPNRTPIATGPHSVAPGMGVGAGVAGVGFLPIYTVCEGVVYALCSTTCRGL